MSYSFQGKMPPTKTFGGYRLIRQTGGGFTQKDFSIFPRQSAFLLLFLYSFAYAEQTLPLDQRPIWLSREGIVMAGNWEPLLFRVRRDGNNGYTPTVEQRAAYLREHSPEMIAELKELGVNFIMMHCYKGAGLTAERESMADDLTPVYVPATIRELSTFSVVYS